MKLTGLDVYVKDSVVISFSLSEGNPSSKYVVRSIYGLDAEDLIHRFYAFGAQTKPRYYDIGLKDREIVIRVALNPRWQLRESYSDIRDEIYKAISPNREGTIVLQFNSGPSAVAQITGFIKKVEVPYFVSTPEVQLTVHCPSPMFRSVAPTLLEASDLGSGEVVVISDSNSTAPHGFFMEVEFTDITDSFIMGEEDSTEWEFEIVPGEIGLDTGFLIGDILRISNDTAKKEMSLTRDETVHHLLDRMTTNSIWPVIFPGMNAFTLSDSTKFTVNKIEYYAAYWGI